MAPYRVSELTIDTRGGLSEQRRTRKIFEDLLNKAKAGSSLSEHEKDFLLRGLHISLLGDGSPESFPILENAIFREKFLLYVFDLTGGSVYHKPFRSKIIEIPRNEVDFDLDYLFRVAEDWEQLVTSNPNPSDYLLRESGKETREELKKLKNLEEFRNIPYSYGSFRFQYKKWSLLLQHKYVHHICELIIEDGGIVKLNIGGTSVDFDQFSLVHIINRHFGQIVKTYHTGKSFHTPDFQPKLLGKELRVICGLLTQTGLLNGNETELIFLWKGKLYHLYINSKVRNDGTVFKRVNTFYPITDSDEVIRVNLMRKVSVSSDLDLYLP